MMLMQTCFSSKKKLRGEFISGKAENLPFRNNVFDYVTVGFD